jgi:hypothetical protein
MSGDGLPRDLLSNPGCRRTDGRRRERGRHVIGTDWHARRIVDVDDCEPRPGRSMAAGAE